MKINVQATLELIKKLDKDLNLHQPSFEEAQILAKNLGSFYKNNQAQFGFWIPELIENNINEISLEIYSTDTKINFQELPKALTFAVQTVPLQIKGQFAFAIINGMKAGTANQMGDLYWLKYKDSKGDFQKIVDPLAHSIPFGAFSPAELFDMNTMFANRTDKAHFEQKASETLRRFETPTNILQLHPHTATAKGSLQGLSELFATISNKLQKGEQLTKQEKCYANYDGIQLLPVMPQVEKERGERFFKILSQSDDAAIVELRQFDIDNWGYDIVIAAASAVNPGLLATKRPNELLELIETLHHFHGEPKKVILDIVYGHSDNQGQQVLNKHFFLGMGMYGQEMNVQHPVVRAIMLESQRRIGNYGVDGFRVDAAQDIVYKDENGTKHYDNDYLHLMNDIVYEVADTKYHAWMVYEDGRPWPNPDWNIATTYDEVIKLIPNALQWGPLTFVNNQPFVFGFWIERFWRVKQIASTGQQWVTGGSNHDTYRGLAHTNPSATAYNSNLGSNLREVAHKGYNNPAARLLDHAFLPGVPMEFINASTDTPWGFLRNSDYQYGVKIFAEETHFLDWFVTDETYDKTIHFKRLKGFGFRTYRQIVDFKNAVYHLTKLTDYNLQQMVEMLRNFDGKFPIPSGRWQLRQMALAYMEDAYEFCNVAHHIDGFDEKVANFNYDARAFRLENAELLNNLNSDDIFDYWHSPNGAVIYYGLRKVNNQEILFIANMEGATTEIDIQNFKIPNFDKNNWNLALKTPNCSVENLNNLILKDSEGLVFVR
jgi:hypothetical protein